MCAGEPSPSPSPTPNPIPTPTPTPLSASASPRRPIFRTADIWQAAYALTYGIRLMRTTVDVDGHATWELDNAEEAAWKAGMEFRRSGDLAVVPIQRFRACHRYLARQAAIARKEGSVDATPDPRC